jgi:hypothetical protein
MTPPQLPTDLKTIRRVVDNYLIADNIKQTDIKLQALEKATAQRIARIIKRQGDITIREFLRLEKIFEEAEDDGHWITTDDGNHLYLTGAGELKTGPTGKTLAGKFGDKKSSDNKIKDQPKKITPTIGIKSPEDIDTIFGKKYKEVIQPINEGPDGETNQLTEKQGESVRFWRSMSNEALQQYRKTDGQPWIGVSPSEEFAIFLDGETKFVSAKDLQADPNGVVMQALRTHSENLDTIMEKSTLHQDLYLQRGCSVDAMISATNTGSARGIYELAQRPDLENYLKENPIVIQQKDHSSWTTSATSAESFAGRSMYKNSELFKTVENFGGEKYDSVMERLDDPDSDIPRMTIPATKSMMARVGKEKWDAMASKLPDASVIPYDEYYSQTRIEKNMRLPEYSGSNHIMVTKQNEGDKGLYIGNPQGGMSESEVVLPKANKYQVTNIVYKSHINSPTPDGVEGLKQANGAGRYFYIMEPVK